MLASVARLMSLRVSSGAPASTTAAELEDLAPVGPEALPATSPAHREPERDGFEVSGGSGFARFMGGVGDSLVSTATGLAHGATSLVTDPVGSGRAVAQGLQALGSAALDAASHPITSAARAYDGASSFVRTARAEDWGRFVGDTAVGLAGGGAVGFGGRLALGAAGRAGAQALGRLGVEEVAAQAGSAAVRTAERVAARLGAEAATPIDLEQGLVRQGFTRVTSGDLQHVYERDGLFVKVADPGRAENRAFNPTWAAQRDLEASQSTTQTLQVFDRLRQEFGSIIPETTRISPTAIAQRDVGGSAFAQLAPEAQAAARRNADAVLARARQVMPDVTFDPNLHNFRFGPSGSVTSWFDPH